MRNSVYTPGAGHQPPVLAGRDELLRDWRLMLNDATARGRVRAQDTLLVGPRGVGKTATLTAFGTLARAQGIEVVSLQAVAGQAGLIETILHRAHTLAAEEGPWRRARGAMERIAGVNINVAGFGAGVTTKDDTPQTPPLDAGNLAAALAAVSSEVRKDAPTGGLLVSVDEIQVAAALDLALLAATLHRLNVDHPTAAVLFAGTGLPVTPESLRQAGVTHPDRLFAIEEIPLTLPPEDARYAIVEPARTAGVTWDPDAVDRLIEITNGYPAHIQLFAEAAWTTAAGPHHVTLADVEASLPKVAALLARRTLGPRWERITDRQMEFIAALAVHGGRASMSIVATTLGKQHREMSWIRDELIKQGDIYAPRHGQIAMAIPMFCDYVLARYPQERQERTGTDLLTLEQMCRNAGLTPPERGRGESEPHRLPGGRNEQGSPATLATGTQRHSPRTVGAEPSAGSRGEPEVLPACVRDPARHGRPGDSPSQAGSGLDHDLSVAAPGRRVQVGRGGQGVAGVLPRGRADRAQPRARPRVGGQAAGRVRPHRDPAGVPARVLLLGRAAARRAVRR